MPQRFIIFLFGAIFIIFSAACGSEFGGNVLNDRQPAQDSDKVKAPGDSPDQGLAAFKTPTKKLAPNEWPKLIDDLNFSSIELAIDRQLKRYKQKDLTGTIQFGADIYKLVEAPKSLTKFREIVVSYRSCQKARNRNCQSQFENQLKENFIMYIPDLKPDDSRYGESKSAFFTAYYTPQIKVSATPTREFRFPIYAKPSSEEKAKANTRVDIDFRGALRGQGLELFYTNDFFYLYLMQVEGSGRAILQTSGKPISSYLHYGGTNSKSWNFISKYMLEHNMISNGSMYAQRKYLNSHPERQEEIYGSCPSYVYFNKSTKPPMGSDGTAITDNRSIATDKNYYKFKGLLALVAAERPRENYMGNYIASIKDIRYREFSRFYLDQDTGGAIRGKARADLYFGEGDYAALAANSIEHRGDIFFLMIKPNAKLKASSHKQ
ncbi:MAG: hypothetical protein A2Z20_04275 [Bdellovibrionales bacterium RBG_16_40_8]|nr:MAG: hypothetical protein A2Z20_04275 [Bdellovibrionales bacterium RBG_16_40_8]